MAVTVNLDALIPRDDFASDNPPSGGSPRNTIGLSDLTTNGFFQNSLRKPDFQRETTHWVPQAVVDLIQAFLDGDLIPAVILWERGDEVFVIDGAHRLSALIAWIRDDYGDGEASNAKFGNGLSVEQRKVADRTRKLVKKQIGSFAEFRGLLGQNLSDPIMSRRLSAIGKRAVVAQWVSAVTVEAAEASFFKINQAAQPIDPVERVILQSRTAPNAVAARAIARGGRGHKYWSGFGDDVQSQIEEFSSEIHGWLYTPPHSQPITSTDVPIAGQGYNALPFIFDLVSVCNNLVMPVTAKSRKIPDALPKDEDGSKTVEFIRSVRKKVQLLSTNYSGSLGLHPLIYCYSSSGNFQPNAFLASIKFAERLDKEGRKDDFIKVRKRFETYLLSNRAFVTLTMSRLGAGARSLSKLVDLYWAILQAMLDDKEDAEIFASLVSREDFKHLKQLEVPPVSATDAPSKRGASASTKSAAFIKEAMETPTKCNICGAAIHANSVTFDHVKRREDGGDNRSDNIRPSHPYCNSGFKS